MGLYILCSIIFLLGVYAVTAKKNLVKIVIGLSILEYAANLLLILIGYRTNGEAPIITPASQETAQSSQVVPTISLSDDPAVWIMPS